MGVQTSKITTASGALAIQPQGGAAVNITGSATTSVSTTNSSGGTTLVTKNYLDGFTIKYPDWNDGKGTNFDDRYVNRAGDTMTGNLNVGASKIILNSGSGNIGTPGTLNCGNVTCGNVSGADITATNFRIDTLPTLP